MPESQHRRNPLKHMLSQSKFICRPHLNWMNDSTVIFLQLELDTHGYKVCCTKTIVARLNIVFVDIENKVFVPKQIMLLWRTSGLFTSLPLSEKTGQSLDLSPYVTKTHLWDPLHLWLIKTQNITRKMLCCAVIQQKCKKRWRNAQNNFPKIRSLQWEKQQRSWKLLDILTCCSLIAEWLQHMSRTVGAGLFQARHLYWALSLSHLL